MHGEPGYSAVTQDVAGSRFPPGVTGASGVPGVGVPNGIAGILEPTTLQATKAEPELPIRGAVSLFIMAQNLNLSMLSAKSDLAASFRATIQEDIARELGPGFMPEHVDVRLLAESAAIPVTITAPSGVSCHDLHRWLCNKPLRWAAGNAGNKSKLSTLEGFSAVCLSPSWCLCTIGPSIVDEASTTVSGGSPLALGSLQVGLAQDLPAVPDEQDLVLPRCLQRTGHTPRDGPGKPPRASPKRRSMAKAPTSSAKVKRNPREAKPNRENSSARQLNFSGLSDTPYYQPMLLGEGFGDETEHISGLFVPSVDATFDSRMSSPQTEERMKPRSHGVNGVVTQPNKQPIESPKRQPDVAHPVFSRQNSSDEEVTFIEDDSVSTPARAAAPRRVGALGSRRSVGVEQPSAASKRLSNTRSRTSSGHSAGHAPKSMPKVEPKETAPAAAPAAPAAAPAAPPSPTVTEERPVVPRAPVVPAAPVPAVPASTSAPTPVETAGYVPTAAAVAGEKTAAEVVEPKPKTEVFQAESEEESESSEASSEGESEEESGDGVTQVRPRRKSTSAEVKDLIGDDSDDSDESDSEEVERSEIPTQPPRTRAESLLSKE
eukprot:s1054_g9.t1